MRTLRALPVIQLMPAASSCQSPDAATPGGRPGKNERPHHHAGNTPSAITSPGPIAGFAHLDKAGRRRAQRIPQPAANSRRPR